VNFSLLSEEVSQIDNSMRRRICQSFCRGRGVVPQRPSISQRRVIIEQMLNASFKSSLDVLSRNIMPALNHSLANAPERFPHIRNPDEMQFNRSKTFTYVLPLKVDSSANVSCRSINSRSSFSRSFPALNATASGRSGESPRAISSAFRKRMTSTLGKNSFAKVVLPAPLQPAIT